MTSGASPGYGSAMVKRRAALLRALSVAVVCAGLIAGCAACTSTSSETWSDPSVPDLHSRVVTVMAQGTSSGDGACSPLVHLEATETTNKVVIRAVTSRPTFSNANCAAVLAVPRPFTVTLARALEQRVLIDAQTGAAEPVLDGSVLPTIAGLPRSFVQRQLFHDERGMLTRTWTVHRTVSYPGVSLAVGPEGSVPGYPRCRTVILNGFDVALWSDGGDTSENFAATWTPKPGEQAQITVQAPSGQWTEARTLALVAHTTRL